MSVVGTYVHASAPKHVAGKKHIRWIVLPQRRFMVYSYFGPAESEVVMFCKHLGA